MSAVMGEFHCEAWGSSAVVYPKILDDAGSVTCARCAVFVSSYREFKRRAERAVDASVNGRRVTGC